MSSPLNVVAKEAALTNVAGDYLDQSTRNVKKDVKMLKIVKQYSGKSALDRKCRPDLPRVLTQECTVLMTFDVGLLKRVAIGALHDSEERGPDAPKCHPKTRKVVQREILGWIGHGERRDNVKRILFLSGPAGSGKTAILGTIADECHKKGLLAASFFFSASSGSPNRVSKRPFILTLVYRLLQQEAIVNLRQTILAIIERDPTVLDKHLDQQLEELILVPLRTVAGQSDPTTWPQVIVVDAVDECQGETRIDSKGRQVQRSTEKTHEEILSLLAHASADPSFPFRILVASRPEPAITHFFKTSPNPALRLFLDNEYNPDADIRLFLMARLSALQRKFNLPDNWEPHGAVDQLVDMASGQFVYATTVLRFVEDTSRGPPLKQLERVLEWTPANASETHPLATLDALYHGILQTSPNPSLAVKWFSVTSDSQHFGLHHEWTQAEPWYKKAVLESSAGEMAYLLGSLSSLVKIVYDSNQFEISFYHKTMRDFLEDPERSGGLHVNKTVAKQFISARHFRILKSTSYFPAHCLRPLVLIVR